MIMHHLFRHIEAELLHIQIYNLYNLRLPSKGDVHESPWTRGFCILEVDHPFFILFQYFLLLYVNVTLNIFRGAQLLGNFYSI